MAVRRVFVFSPDLASKNEYGLDEDDKRIPECIADNASDNVATSLVWEH